MKLISHQIQFGKKVDFAPNLDRFRTKIVIDFAPNFWSILHQIYVNFAPNLGQLSIFWGLHWNQPKFGAKSTFLTYF